MRRISRFPNNLTENDRRTYRRWMASLLLSYAAAVTVAIALTALGKPSGDLTAANEQQMAKPNSSQATTVVASSPPVNWP